MHATPLAAATAAARFSHSAVPAVPLQFEVPLRPSLNPSAACRILILNSVRHRGDSLRNTIQTVLLTASITLAGSLAETITYLDTSIVDLLVTDVTLADGDLLDALPEWRRRNRDCGRVMIVSSRREPQILDVLRGYPLAGYFDESTESVDAFAQAIATVESGGSYWSQSVVDRIISDCLRSNSPFAQLTLTERVVLGAIGDGSDDKTAARILGLATNTIRNVRGDLHRKLGVHHKGELIRKAAELGFVYTGHAGITRIGFATLLSAYQAVSRRHAA